MITLISGRWLPVHRRPDPVREAAQGLRGRGSEGRLQRLDEGGDPKDFVRKNFEYRKTISSCLSR
jgi:hypothetical protein